MASTDLTFTTAPKDRPDVDQTDESLPAIERTIPIELDGETYLVKRPKDALVARLGPATQRRTNALLKVSLAMDFLGDCVQEPGRTRLTNRLEDENDDFDVTDALAILEKIAEAWKPEGRRSRSGR